MNSQPSQDVVAAARQQQFLDVVDRDTAEERFHAHLDLSALGSENVSLGDSLDRVLAADVISGVDVPAFDRSNVDGFAVRANDTSEAMEETPRRLSLNDEILVPGARALYPVEATTGTTIATGAVIPRGADAVVMVEYTRVDESGMLLVERPAAPGDAITFAGTDIARGETVVRGRQVLSSREIGVLAAIGLDSVAVIRKPRVAIISTGDEIIPPGAAWSHGAVYDSNAAILAAAIVELGGEPDVLGCIADDEPRLTAAVEAALGHDLVLLSGGTSKGAGDLSYRVVSALPDPGIVVHGVALKPGKPICLAVAGETPVVILPGFPTSAVFTFYEFVAPVIRRLAGRADQSPTLQSASLPMRVNSEKGRTEYLLVSLADDGSKLAAYPMGKGSGSVTTFSGADGFLTIPSQTEYLDAGTPVEIELLGRQLAPADLVVIGSHCVGLDYLLGVLQHQGFAVKSLFVGSNGGLAAVRRGECDCAGIHLVDPATGTYNRPFLDDNMDLLRGYDRMQGLLFRRDDERVAAGNYKDALQLAIDESELRMVNRNAGSGTRVLLDQILDGRRPAGYPMQVRSHNAVAAAIEQQRADWGVAIAPVAEMYGLGFLPIQAEQFDLIVPSSRRQRPAVVALEALLQDPEVRLRLAELGFSSTAS